MLPWGDREYRRFEVRVGIFRRRGWSVDRAEAFADRLAQRDLEQDDRRACIECAHLQRTGACFASAQGWLRELPVPNGRDGRPLPPTITYPVTDLLQRCHAFKAAKPA